MYVADNENQVILELYELGTQILAGKYSKV
jgi:hypothetical protein